MNLAASIPVIGGLFDDSDEKALEQLRQNQALYQSIQLPDFAKYNPEQYTAVGSYDPTMAQAQTVSEDPMVRSAQMSALSKLANLSNVGLSDADQAGFERARQLAGQVSAGGTGAALQNAQSRGVGGSGLEFVMREQAAQDAAQRAQESGLAQASQSAQQRALYNQAYGNALAGLRSQDYNVNAGNADILNKFNLYNTGNANQAQQYNLGMHQNLANQNVTNANQAQLQNNQYAQQGFQNAMTRANGQANANNGVAAGYEGQNAANTAARNTNTGLIANAVGLGSQKKQGDGNGY